MRYPGAEDAAFKEPEEDADGSPRSGVARYTRSRKAADSAQAFEQVSKLHSANLWIKRRVMVG